jgi:hypothetical protein
MIRLTDVKDLREYLNQLDAKIAHHAAYAACLVPPLLTALLRHADDGSIRQFGGDNNKGAVVLFTYRQRPFRLKGHKAAEQIVLVDSRRKDVIATFDAYDEDIEQKFADTLRKSDHRRINLKKGTSSYSLPAIQL